MTDNEIIKSLEICANDGDCKNCRINPHRGNYGYCTSIAIKAALDLINRQREEIDRLADRNHKCIYLSDDETTEYCVDGPCPKFKTEAQIKAEAVKEFAERLKKKETTAISCKRFEGVISTDDIDNLVKEFTEGG